MIHNTDIDINADLNKENEITLFWSESFDSDSELSSEELLL